MSNDPPAAGTPSTSELRRAPGVRHAASFAAVIREKRQAAGLSLRKAASALGVSFSYLQRLEAGRHARVPSMELFEQMAQLYGVSESVLLTVAGYPRPDRWRVEARIHRDFRSLVLHPRLRPRGMTEEWLDAFSVRQKRQWIEFAHRLEFWLDSDDPEHAGLFDILAADPLADGDDGPGGDANGAG